jgi:hypothetical protein
MILSGSMRIREVYERSPIGQAYQGLMIVTPLGSKSDTFLVTTVMVVSEICTLYRSLESGRRITFY